jgi:hypothetical protein
MGRKATNKASKVEREKIQLSLPPASLKKLRIAAAELSLDMSEIVAILIDREFSGVHVRGLNSDIGNGTTEQGGTVKISTMNRIGDIARRSTSPVDQALDDFEQD